MKKYRVFIHYQNTSKKEDFVLTPFLFLVQYFGENIQVLGIGIGIGWWNIAISVGCNVPKNYPTFRNIKP